IVITVVDVSPSGPEAAEPPDVVEAPTVVEISKLPARERAIEAAAKARTSEAASHMAAESPSHMTSESAPAAESARAAVSAPSASPARERVSAQSAGESGSGGQDDHGFAEHWTTPSGRNARPLRMKTPSGHEHSREARADRRGSEHLGAKAA